MLTKVAIHLALVTVVGCTPALAQAPLPRPSVFQTTLEEPNQKTPEVTTEQLQSLLKIGMIPVFDVRTAEEYAIAHIPGSINIYEKEVQHILEVCPPDRDAPGCPKFLPGSPGTPLSPRMILYCNGPSCGKSKRTSEELLALGYTAADVSRYQLGIPVWRALSLTVQTDLPGLLYIFSRDRTAVFVDARTPAEFAAGTIPGAVNVQKGEAVAANDDGRLPFRDKSTRVVVFGNDAQQAQVVGAEVAKRAYWGSSYFGGTLADLLAAGLINHPPVILAKNAVVAADGSCTAVVNASHVDNGSSDPDGDSLALSVLPATPLGLGSHAVLLSGTDGRGATQTATATVEVADQTPPAIGPLDIDSGRPQRNGWVAVALEYALSDNCGTATAAVAAQSWRGAPDDVNVIDSHHLLLRAGMVYRISVTARDPAGNESTLSKVILVPAPEW